jgi:hypothetical protein
MLHTGPPENHWRRPHLAYSDSLFVIGLLVIAIPRRCPQVKVVADTTAVILVGVGREENVHVRAAVAVTL